MAAGASCVIAKPCTVGQIADVLERYQTIEVGWVSFIGRTSDGGVPVGYGDGSGFVHGIPVDVHRQCGCDFGCNYVSHIALAKISRSTAYFCSAHPTVYRSISSDSIVRWRNRKAPPLNVGRTTPRQSVAPTGV